MPSQPRLTAKLELSELLRTRKTTLILINGGTQTLDFSKYPQEKIAVHFAEAIWWSTQIGGAIGSLSTAKRYIGSIKRFFVFLDENYPNLSTITQLEPKHIDEFELWLSTNLKVMTNFHQVLSKVINCLRRMNELHSNLVSSKTVERLSYITEHQIKANKPRDAYNSNIATTLRNKSKEDILAIHKRMTTDKNHIPYSITNDDLQLDIHYINILILIDEYGIVSHEEPDYQSLYKRRKLLNITKQNAHNSLSYALHGTRHLLANDIIPLFIYLSLETGLESECCKSLTYNCLKNPSKGYVEIEYKKLRAQGAEWKRLRVRDGGITTPGGLIRLIKILTENSRKWVQSDSLWIYFHSGTLFSGIKYPKVQLVKWIDKHNIKDDQGKPLKLQLSRLRKTHKAEWYIKTQGQMEQFTVGHSKDVAANHYADIPALRHIHHNTIATAIQDALSSAQLPILITPDQEMTLIQEPNQNTDITPEHIKSINNTDQDVWLASCSNFYDSPFGKKGEPCPQPFWGCLECQSAVITSRKLPSLISFLNFMINQRKILTSMEWETKFSRPFLMIQEKILPHFPEDVINSAKTIADTHDDLLYLPPEVHAG